MLLIQHFCFPQWTKWSQCVFIYCLHASLYVLFKALYLYVNLWHFSAQDKGSCISVPPSGREPVCRSADSVHCSPVGLGSLCEMSTGVNEYLLSQSPGNPPYKMLPSLIRSTVIHGGRPLASSSQLKWGFFTPWSLSCSFIFLLLKHWWNWVHLLLGDLLLVVAMKLSTSCLIYPPACLPCFCLFITVALSQVLLCYPAVHFCSPPFFSAAHLCQRIEQVIFYQIIPLWHEN